MAGKKYRSKWQQKEAVAKWKASGLNQAEFCRRENIPEWALSTWKRRELKEEAAKNDDQAGARSYSPPKSREKMPAFWRRMVQELAQSGLNASEFCRRHGIRLHTFHRWRRKFAGEETVGSIPTKEDFVQFCLPGLSKPNQSVEIVLPGGSTMKITEHTSLDLVSKLLRALEEKC